MINAFNRIFQIAFAIFLIASATSFAQSDTAEQTQPAIEKQLRDTISLWGGAWAAQIPDAYFDFYSARYIAPGFDSREAWMADRRRRIEEPESIRIRLLDFELVESSEILVGEILATTRFTLIYERPGYRDTTYKEMELLGRDGEWKITAERNLRVEIGEF